MGKMISLGDAVHPNTHPDQLGSVGQQLCALAEALNKLVPNDMVLDTILAADLWSRVDGRVRQLMAEESFRSQHHETLECLRQRASKAA